MKRFLLFYSVFLIINFTGLGLGAYLQGNILENTWYAMLSKAPWTPPGWVFGFAWTLIMLLYSNFLALIASKNSFSSIRSIYIASWILNLIWSPLFFVFHLVELGLIVLVLLLGCIVYQFLDNKKKVAKNKILLLPYILWLLIAISLNGYVLLNN